MCQSVLHTVHVCVCFLADSSCLCLYVSGQQLRVHACVCVCVACEHVCMCVPAELTLCFTEGLPPHRSVAF